VEFIIIRIIHDSKISWISDPFASSRFNNETIYEIVRERKTAVDWAQEIKTLLEEDYADVEKVVRVCDNLNTHKEASLYSAFESAKALRRRKRLEIHYTPKHGSWLNMAGIEWSIFTRQCLDRRMPSVAVLRQEANQGGQERNRRQKSVDWQFTTEDDRIKLKRLYSQFRLS